MIVKRKLLEKALQIIASSDAGAFYSVEDVKLSSGETTGKMKLAQINKNTVDR